MTLTLALALVVPSTTALDVVGPQADEIGWLWDVFLGVSIAVATAVVVVLIAAATRAIHRRRHESPEDPLATDPRQLRRMQIVIAGAVATTVLTLIALLVASVSSGRALAALPHTGAVEIQVTGHQWWWQVEYIDPAPYKRVTTANEIHVPVGVPVLLRLRSSDVIHSFWIPAIHGKKDLIPGRENTTMFRVDVPGVFWGRCAEFCGLQHANMAIAVIAEPPEQFHAWLDHQREPSSSPTSVEIAHGRDVFLRGTCAMCHSIAGTTAGAGLGPDLTHIASRLSLGAGTEPNTPEHLASWIADAQHDKPGSRMPPNTMSDHDLAALVAYLETLR